MSIELEQRIAQACAPLARPEPIMTVSQWADEYRMLSSKASAEQGHWTTARTPYLREIMDALSPSSPVQEVALMKGSQIGGTEILLNFLGYIVHQAPGPALLVEPTVEVAMRISKQRLAPMIEATPALRDRVSEPRSRDSGNTLSIKEFPGGTAILTGANSGAGLRSMPIRYLLMDEVTLYPGDVEGEGDPVALARARTSNFSNRKVVLVSTPGVKGICRMEKLMAVTDQRRFFIPCPHCSRLDWIRWSNIRWSESDPDTARLACEGCGSLIEERHKTAMLAAGEWRPTAKNGGPSRGYYLSGLYSPLGWKSWADCAQQFLAAKDDPYLLKQFVTHVLGETWEERGDSVEIGSLLARLERYPAEVPTGVGVLVASVDVQADRLEVQVTGFGAQEESWLVAHSQIPGDPGTETVWFDLDRFLATEFTHEGGQKVRIEITAVDSGGHHTEAVYRFCKTRLARRVFAVKGGSESGKPVVGPPSVHNRYRTPLFVLCTDTAKDVIYSRLRIATPGPGYVHLPNWADAEYVAQLTAEKKIRKWFKGRGSVPMWVKMRDRNEALDLTVYCLAALYIGGQALVRTLPERAARLAAKGEVTAGAGEPGPRVPRPVLPRRHGWMDRWR